MYLLSALQYQVVGWFNILLFQIRFHFLSFFKRSHHYICNRSYPKKLPKKKVVKRFIKCGHQIHAQIEGALNNILCMNERTIICSIYTMIPSMTKKQAFENCLIFLFLNTCFCIWFCFFFSFTQIASTRLCVSFSATLNKIYFPTFDAVFFSL